MIKFIQNCINVKVTWKILLKYFYYFAKINALAHFTYDVEQRQAIRFSLISTIYGWIWVVGHFMLLIFNSFYLDVVLDDEKESFIFYFVSATELFAALLKVVLIYFLQLINSKDLILLINDAFNINQVISYEYREDINLKGYRFVKLYNFKKRCIFLQFILIFWSYYNYTDQYDEISITELINNFLICYTHFSTVIVSGLYFYGFLLVGYDFYFSLNRKLRQILKEIELTNQLSNKLRVENYCRASEDIDKISRAYTRITSYMANSNKIFSIQIAIELLGSFFMVTSAVSIFM